MVTKMVGHAIHSFGLSFLLRWSQLQRKAVNEIYIGFAFGGREEILLFPQLKCRQLGAIQRTSITKIWSSRIARHSSSCLGDNSGKTTDAGVGKDVVLAVETAADTMGFGVAFFFTMLITVVATMIE